MMVSSSVLGVLVLVCSSGVQAQGPPPPFGVNGTVLDTSGEPIAGATVRLILDSPKGGKLGDTVETDGRGRFATHGWIVTSTDGEGDWRLEITAEGRATTVVDELFLGYGVYDVGPVYLFSPVLVRGRVVDVRGRPVAGAAVYAAHGEALWSSHDYAERGPATFTEADGSYTFEVLPPGLATIGISARGHADATAVGVQLSAEEANSRDFALGREVLLSGRVADRDLSPIPLARVETAHSFWRVGTPVDQGGNFAVRGIGTQWSGPWMVRAPGFVPMRMGNEATEAVPVILDRSAVVRIFVEAEDGTSPRIESLLLYSTRWVPSCFGDPANEAEVRTGGDHIQELSPQSWLVFWEAAFEPLPGESFGLSSIGVDLEDGANSWVRIVPVSGFGGLGYASEPTDDQEVLRTKDGTLEIIIRVPQPGGIAGRVLTAGDGKPVPGTTVMTNRWSVITPDLVATTDADGRFFFEGMTPGDLHDLCVDNEYWQGRIPRVTVRSGETTECVLYVDPPPRIHGRLLLAGQAPGQPVVVGLGEFQRYSPEHTQVVPGGWFGLGMADADGYYSVVPRYGRKYTVVPKNHTGPEHGGYRRFQSEFPETELGSWPWEVQAPTQGQVLFHLDVR